MEGADSALRIIVVEDEALFRDALRIALAQVGQLEIVGVFPDGPSALAATPRLRPRVAVLDIALPGGINGVHLGRLLRRSLPDLGIVLLSHYRDPAVLSGVPEGDLAGWSYLLKSTVRDVATLTRAIQGTAAGQVVLDEELVGHGPVRPDGPLQALAPRQREILGLIAQGYSNTAIAERLGVAVKTIENQINVIFRALDVDPEDRRVQPRVQAVLAYLRAMRLAHLTAPAPD